ncbi:sodium-dependent transporter [Dasania sp. GY-MA-18]|uniref:Transporter n=1 Tax=Dasania phycosphaerae TaxID=2950436 RepID=A0A9J6RMP4_9GAMM|nr:MULTISPECIES: sodium-dependent transporter [Dasania]MCR8922822.1 sodium-dependent transporter [Dasania sp. GY-MA-18]MCZ0865253.1 sodium-dependent transporter [Dasania phycosphaerae]MCZ0868978.1 sodium-dependent transporter [Dasania phycosphaerae]
MSNNNQQQWSSRWGFMLAAMGSAVGLANIWRFPYAAGESGGGAFVLVYLGAVLTVALPLLIAELLVGRRGQASPPNAIAAVAQEAGGSRLWKKMGYGGSIAAILILAFYCVVGGWTLTYILKMASGSMSGMSGLELGQAFDEVNANPWLMLLAFSAFLGITVFISSKGIQGGVERTVKLLMPTLLIMLVAMVLYSAITGEFIKALSFLFNPDFSRITPAIVLDAFGQAFFSVSVGYTNLMAYGAYLKKDINIPSSCAVIVGADTLVALLAGLAIFPIIFSYGLEPDGGPGLVFMTLPIVFGSVSGGAILGALFFLLLSFAALTSSLSMLEAPVAWFSDLWQWSRKKSVYIAGALVWSLGLLCVFSFNLLADVHPLGMFTYFEGKTFFDLYDFVTTRIAAPVIGTGIAIFVGWVMTKKMTAQELSSSETQLGYKLWLYSVRFLVPVVLSLLCYSMLTN